MDPDVTERLAARTLGGFLGDSQYAHRGDERIDSWALVRSYDVLRRFLAAQEEY